MGFRGYVGCSQNYGPPSVIDYIAAPTISGYKNGTLILGTLHTGGNIGMMDVKPETTIL